MSFDFSSSKPEADDPMADFLARERANAGALGDDAALFGGSGAAGGGGDKDFASSAAAFPALDGLDDAAPAAASSSSASALASAPTAPAPPQPAADERQQFERDFPELVEEDVDAAAGVEHVTMPPTAVNGGGTAANGLSAAAAAPSGRTPDPYGRDDDEEPEPIRQWKAKQADEIARKDAEAERKKAEAVSQAEQDIDRFYVEYNAKKEKGIQANKEAEARFLEQHQRDLAEGTTWSRVTRLLELQNSQSKTIAKPAAGAGDLARMRDVLLSLRREGETAPAAAGY